MRITNNFIISILFFLTLIPSLGFGPLNISLASGLLVVILCILERKYSKDFVVKYSAYAIFSSVLVMYSLFRQGFSFRNVNITNSSPEIEIMLKYIYLIFIPLIIYSFYKYSRKINFEKVFVLFNLMSLMTYILKVFGISLADILPISSIGLRDYGRFIIGNIDIDFLHRNTFLSGEPSFLAGTLVIMFYLTSKKSTKLLILMNLILTTSRLGYVSFVVCALLSIIMHVLGNKKRNIIKTFFLVILIFMTLIVGVFVFDDIWEIAFTDLSTRARFNAVITSLIMIKDNMILGIGIGRYPYEYHNYEFISNLGQYKIPNPGSLYTLVSSEGGILAGLLFLFCMIKLFNKIKNKKLKIAYISMLIFWINTAHIQLIWQWSFLGLLIGGENIILKDHPKKKY